MGLGQGHCAGEAAAEHVWQEGAFLLVVAEHADQVGGSGGEERVTRSARVSGGEEAVTRCHDRFGELHATQFVVVAPGNEAGIGVGVKGFFDLRQHFHLAVDEFWLVFVGGAVVGSEFVTGDFVGGFDDGVEGVAAVFAKALAFAEAFGVEYFVELERQVAAVNQGVGHFGSPVYGV